MFNFSFDQINRDNNTYSVASFILDDGDVVHTLSLKTTFGEGQQLYICSDLLCADNINYINLWDNQLKTLAISFTRTHVRVHVW